MYGIVQIKNLPTRAVTRELPIFGTKRTRLAMFVLSDLFMLSRRIASVASTFRGQFSEELPPCATGAFFACASPLQYEITAATSFFSSRKCWFSRFFPASNFREMCLNSLCWTVCSWKIPSILCVFSSWPLSSWAFLRLCIELATCSDSWPNCCCRLFFSAQSKLVSFRVQQWGVRLWSSCLENWSGPGLLCFRLCRKCFKSPTKSRMPCCRSSSRTRSHHETIYN